MKKVFLCAAAVAMLGLASCSNKAAEAEDSAVLDTAVEVVTEVAVDSVNPDSAQVTVEQAAEEVVAPAAAE